MCDIIKASNSDTLPLRMDMSNVDLQLSGRQSVLAEAITARDPRLSAMYVGAICALAQTHNPDRLAHAAHGMRELMEKLPLYLDGKREDKNRSLKEAVNDLEILWKKAVQKSKCFLDGAWEGAIDPPLRKALSNAVEFFAWHENANPKRKEQTAAALKGLDPSGKALPKPIAMLRVEEWHTLVGYFQGVAHHNVNVDLNEFDLYLEQAEHFLLQQLRPRVFSDHDELTSLIREAENGAET